MCGIAGIIYKNGNGAHRLARRAANGERAGREGREASAAGAVGESS